MYERLSCMQLFHRIRLVAEFLGVVNESGKVLDNSSRMSILYNDDGK